MLHLYMILYTSFILLTTHICFYCRVHNSYRSKLKNLQRLLKMWKLSLCKLGLHKCIYAILCFIVRSNFLSAIVTRRHIPVKNIVLQFNSSMAR